MLGYCKEQVKEFKEAMNNYLISESLGFYNDELFNSIGHLNVQEKDFNKGLIYFNKSISVNPKYALAHYNKGIALYALGFKESAIESWNKSKEFGFANFDKEIIEIIEKN